VDAPPTEEDEDCPGVREMIEPDNRIPATIITGFLGSGKVQEKHLRINLFQLILKHQVLIWISDDEGDYFDRLTVVCLLATPYWS
jgi:hypothetical protein